MLICSLGWPVEYMQQYASMKDMQDTSMDKCNVPDLCNDDLDSIRKMVKRMELASYSTAFSGVDSPGTALAMLRSAAGVLLGEETLVIAPRYMHAIVSSQHGR